MPNLIEFIWIWNQIQKLSIPRHHVKMARFLSDLWLKAEHKWGLLMAFRNSGKSTLVGLFCAWALFINPNVRILVLSADHGLAKKMVRNIKKILEQHPLTRSLVPEKKDEWASDRFTVCRTQNLRDPSVLGRGLLANMTGCRADIIICDDVEVPKTSDTSLKRRDLRQKLSELDYILTPGGLMLYIGTPHTRQTIYDTTSEGFLRDFHILKIPILNTKGQSNWPERFPLEQIQAIRVRSGPAKFLSQMMLEATSLEKARLNPNDILGFGLEGKINLKIMAHTNKFDFNNIMPYGPQILDMFPQSRRHALRRRINTFLLELDDRDDETTVSVSVSRSLSGKWPTASSHGLLVKPEGH